MNNVSVLFNNRIEYQTVNFPEQVVAFGDWILTPVRYMCAGNKVQFLNDGIVIEKEYGSSHEKSDKPQENYLRTAAFIVLLVPAFFLGTLVKALGYFSQAIRDLHHRVVQTLDSQSISSVPSTKSRKDAAEDHSKLDQEQGNAATKIQSVWKGHVAKVKYNKAKRHFLSYALLEKAKPFVDDKSLRAPLKSIRARSTVYFLQDPPLVLKQSRAVEDNHLRFKKISEAQKICETNQYNHLEIPPAILYGGFLVEKKLPFEFLMERITPQKNR